MKRIMAFVIVMCILLPLCGCAAANPSSSTVTDPPPVTTVTPPTTTQPEPTTTQPESTLLEEMKRLAAEATQMFESGQEFTFPTNWFVDWRFGGLSEGKWIDNVTVLQDGVLTIRTDVDTALVDMDVDADAVLRVKERQRYLIFLMLLYEEYEDCITEGDYAYDASYGRVYVPYLIIFREYEKAGFATVTDWWKACREEDYEMTGEIYGVVFNRETIFAVPDEWTNLYTEIFEELP